jgi:site-specific DNA-methyltransferase (adenine-specific)
MAEFTILVGDAVDKLKTLPSESCHTTVTSPPYFRQRDYYHPDQLGQEKTPEEFVTNLANVFDEVKRVLRKDGTLWVVIDDTYINKQLAGVPWMFAFEMKRRGWVLRCDIIWTKGSCTPEPCRDRPTRNHEYVFLFSKQLKYYYDLEAVREPHTNPWVIDCLAKAKASGQVRRTDLYNPFSKEERRAKGQRGVTRAMYGALMNPNGKNKRSVWHVNTDKFKGAHFAVYPVDLVVPCIRAGCPPRGTVLDPFAGAGSTGVAALLNDRNFVGIELVSKSATMAIARLASLLSQASNASDPEPALRTGGSHPGEDRAGAQTAQTDCDPSGAPHEVQRMSVGDLHLPGPGL